MLGCVRPLLIRTRFGPSARPVYTERFLSMAASEEIDVEGLQANYRDILQRVEAAKEGTQTKHVRDNGCSDMRPQLHILRNAGQAGSR